MMRSRSTPCRRRAAWLALAGLVSPPLAGSARLAQGTVWEVGPQPGADFAAVAEAITSPLVLAGDTLKIAPGWNSPGFVLDKPLNVVASAGEQFWTGPVTVRDVPYFSIAGLRTEELHIENVSGRGVLDDVHVGEFYVFEQAGEWIAYLVGRARVRDCAELVISRAAFHGSDACFPWGVGSESACTVIASRVAFIECYFKGGDAFTSGCEVKFATPARAIEISAGSDVTLAGCTAIAGNPGISGVLPAALQVNNSKARVMGDGTHTYAAAPSKEPIDADAQSLVRVSGVVLEPPILSPGVVYLAEAEPFLRVTGSDAPPAAKQIELFGPAGAWARLAVSPEPALLLPPPPIRDLLWLDPAAAVALFPVLCLGPSTPSLVPLPDLGPHIGAVLWVQATLPTSPADKAYATNVAAALARW